MATIAPWLVPPDFIRASQAGGSLGLQARGQDIAQSEAGDRLRLAYGQLAAQQAEAANRMQAHQAEVAQQIEADKQQAAAAMALRERGQSALDAYRQGELGVQGRRVDLAAKQASDRLTGKQYGDIQQEEIAPGISAVYRPGSPGLHIVNKSTGKPLDLKSALSFAQQYDKMAANAFADPAERAAAKQRADFFRTHIKTNFPQMAGMEAGDGEQGGEQLAPGEMLQIEKEAEDTVPDRGPLDRFGSNMRGLGEMLSPSKAPAGGKVRVISPDGKPGMIPADQLEEALGEGYKRAE